MPSVNQLIKAKRASMVNVKVRIEATNDADPGSMG